MVIDGLLKLQAKIEYDQQFGTTLERSPAAVA
jgi:hypothetical protein